MSANWAKFLQVVAALMFVSGLLMWSDLRWRNKTPQTVVETRVDTLVVYDTITAYKPVPFNVYVVDTMWVPVTVHEHDTIWAQLPREAKVYQDSAYRAVVSGFRPSLDSIEVYRKMQTVIVTQNVRIPPPRWSWGVQTGVGWNPGGGFSPYIGVGIQYRLGDLDFRK